MDTAHDSGYEQADSIIDIFFAHRALYQAVVLGMGAEVYEKRISEKVKREDKMNDYVRMGFRPGYDPKNRVVKQEVINIQGVSCFISTIDLGLNHSDDGSPLYFETIIFTEDRSDHVYMDRYPTRKMALESHERIVGQINDGLFEVVDGWFEWKVKERGNKND